jgi:hypothetical protein
MTKDLINQITDYLSSGGLFNPELADHNKVRDLLIECREALEVLEKIANVNAMDYEYQQWAREALKQLNTEETT